MTQKCIKPPHCFLNPKFYQVSPLSTLPYSNLSHPYSDHFIPSLKGSPLFKQQSSTLCTSDFPYVQACFWAKPISLSCSSHPELLVFLPKVFMPFPDPFIYSSKTPWDLSQPTFSLSHQQHHTSQALSPLWRISPHLRLKWACLFLCLMSPLCFQNTVNTFLFLICIFVFWTKSEAFLNLITKIMSNISWTINIKWMNNFKLSNILKCLNLITINKYEKIVTHHSWTVI